jgi:hypothetical protein
MRDERSWSSYGRLLAVLALGLLVVGAACGGDDDSDGGGSAEDIAATLADRAEEEFNSRNEGTFFDTGFITYCRLNKGFDGGVFNALGYTDASAPSGYELCYNLSDDLKRVALGVISAKTGDTTCVVLDASSGSAVRGEIREVDRCVP